MDADYPEHLDEHSFWAERDMSAVARDSSVGRAEDCRGFHQVVILRSPVQIRLAGELFFFMFVADPAIYHLWHLIGRFTQIHIEKKTLENTFGHIGHSVCGCVCVFD